MGIFDRWQKKQREKTQKAGAKQAPPAKVVEQEKKEIVSEPAASVAARKVSVMLSNVIIKPAVTEKAAVAESINKYTFFVDRHATKKEIKAAINEIYGVVPEAVNLINIEGKNVRFGRHQGRRSDRKKALVTLPKGKTISVHEGV